MLGKHNATKGKTMPLFFFFVSLEIVNDELWIQCFDYGWIEHDEIVDPNSTNH